MAANSHSLDLELSSSQYAYAADSASLSIVGDLTLECWVKFESLPSSNVSMQLLTKIDTTTPQRSYIFSLFNNAGTLQLRLQNSDDGTATASAAVAFTPTTGIFYHLAVAYDASAGTADFYVNGIAQGTQQSGLKTSIYNSTAPFLIGTRLSSGSPTDFLDGLIDDARVWDDIRTATEIHDNIFKDVTAEANLVGYWKLDNDYLDATANNNDLTASGSPVFSTTVPFPDYSTLNPVELNSTSLINDANLQGYWRMESDWNDSSSNAYNLTPSGSPTFVASKFGNGGNFVRASSQYAKSAGANLIKATSQSYGCWIKPTAIGLDQRFIGASNASTTSYTNLILPGATNKIAFEMNGLSTPGVASNTVIAAGNWYHAVGVFDSVGNTIKIYINGILEGVVTGTTGTHTTDGTFGIGIMGDYAADFFGGIMDDAFFFDRVLTADEIFDLYVGAQAGTAYEQTLTDTLVLTDSIIKTPVRNLTETITYTDTLLKVAARILSETVTLTDTLLKMATRNLSETINHTDTLIKATVRNLTETINLTDTFERLWIVIKELSETINLTDTLLKLPTRTLSETINLTDTLIKDTARIFTETITLTDSIIKGSLRVLSETITLTDTVIRSMVKILTETVSLTDTLEKVFNGIRTGIVGAIRSIVDNSPFGGVRDNNPPTGITRDPDRPVRR